MSTKPTDPLQPFPDPRQPGPLPPSDPGPVNG